VDDITLNLRRRVEPPNLEKLPAQPHPGNVPKTPVKQSTGPVLPKQEISRPLNEYASFAETFQGQFRYNLLKEAKTLSGIAKSSVETRIAQTESRRLEWVKTGYELYIKYSFALVCFVFLFIGAPMGAIIRKGGFGYPILVSIIFFVAFIFLTILCRKLAESNVMTPFWAAMMPCISMIPVGGYLTSKAMNDAQLFRNEYLNRLIFWLSKRFQKKSTPETV